MQLLHTIRWRVDWLGPVRKRLAALLTLTFLVLATAPLLAASVADGELDLSFGKNGIATFGSANSFDAAMDVVIQPDGRIVSTGWSSIGNDDATAAFSVVRHLPSGALDSSFGTGGAVVHKFLSSTELAVAIALQGDGRIVVAGSGNDGERFDVAVARYLSNGIPDTSFGDSGMATSKITARDDYGTGIAIQPDGKIVVSGTNLGEGDVAEPFVLRFDRDGVLDPTFSSDGIAMIPLASGGSAEALFVVVQPDGRIVTGGAYLSGVQTDMYAARFMSNGAIDTSFSGDGIAIVPVGANDDAAFDGAIQIDGKIILAGSAEVGVNQHFALVRLLPDGNIDTTFGIGGKVISSFGSGGVAYSVALQADHKILAAGVISATPDDYAIGLARYNANGGLDTTFDNNGVASTNLSDEFDHANGLAIQADGKIVVAGTANDLDAAADAVLVRYHATVHIPPENIVLYLPAITNH